MLRKHEEERLFVFGENGFIKINTDNGTKVLWLTFLSRKVRSSFTYFSFKKSKTLGNGEIPYRWS